jgi:hypothetical protein
MVQWYSARVVNQMTHVLAPPVLLNFLQAKCVKCQMFVVFFVKLTLYLCNGLIINLWAIENYIFGILYTL